MFGHMMVLRTFSPLREGTKFIETGAGHIGTGVVTFNTVNHGAVTYFYSENHGA